MLHITYSSDNIDGGNQTFRKSRRGQAACNRLVRFLRKHHDNVKISITHID